MITDKTMEVTTYTHTCSNQHARAGVTISIGSEVQENGRIPWSNYCPNCGEILPQWISKEAQYNARPSWVPCECGAAVHRDVDTDRFICTNPPCKWYGQEAHLGEGEYTWNSQHQN